MGLFFLSQNGADDEISDQSDNGQSSFLESLLDHVSVLIDEPGDVFLDLWNGNVSNQPFEDFQFLFNHYKGKSVIN